MSRRQRILLWSATLAGVPIGYAGLWLDTPLLMWFGIGLSLPLFVVVLPYCVLLLTAVLTHSLWFPVYRMAIRKNGAPFHPGDLVYMKRGLHRDRIAPVYEVWAERDQLRVELGEDERAELTDVVSYLSVRKVRDADRHPGL